MLIFENFKNLSDAMVAFSQSKTFRYNGFPDVDQLKRHSAAFFVNTDPLLEYPRALPPHVIPVGGLHIDHPKPLFAVSSNIIISENFTILPILSIVLEMNLSYAHSTSITCERNASRLEGTKRAENRAKPNREKQTKARGFISKMMERVLVVRSNEKFIEIYNENVHWSTFQKNCIINLLPTRLLFIIVQPWNTTIESAEEGMIIVSLGTQADSGYMTEKQVRA